MKTRITESLTSFVADITSEAVLFEHDRSEVHRLLEAHDWRGALRAAIAAGERDETKLTNLLFFAHHPQLDPNRELDPKASKEDAKLAKEWSAISKREVWPAIEEAATNSVLAVHGAQIASWLVHFRGKAGERFKQLVEAAARKVDLNPGLLAAALLAETGTTADYLTASKVGSYRTGVDDFYAMRGVLAKNVPAYAQIRWDKKQKPEAHLNDAKTNPREVQSIWFDSGADALLATAVYLKYAEIRLHEDAEKLGGDFADLPVETRFALIRMSMAAGRAGAAKRLAKALKGKDVLVRNWKPPVIYHTDRNATIRAAEAMFLSGWVFGQPLSAKPVTKLEPELFGGADDQELEEAEKGEEDFGLEGEEFAEEEESPFVDSREQDEAWLERDEPDKEAYEDLYTSSSTLGYSTWPSGSWPARHRSSSRFPADGRRAFRQPTSPNSERSMRTTQPPPTRTRSIVAAAS